MKLKILYSLLLLTTINVFAQDITIAFGHDDAGNITSWSKNNGFFLKSYDSLTTQTVIDDNLLIDDSFEDQLKMYPNPTSNLVYLEWTDTGSNLVDKVQLIDVLGTTDTPIQIIQPGFVSIDLSHKPPGLYFIKFHLENNSQSIIRKKIIKK